MCITPLGTRCRTGFLIKGVYPEKYQKQTAKTRIMIRRCRPPSSWTIDSLHRNGYAHPSHPTTLYTSGLGLPRLPASLEARYAVTGTALTPMILPEFIGECRDMCRVLNNSTTANITNPSSPDYIGINRQNRVAVATGAADCAPLDIRQFSQ